MLAKYSDLQDSLEKINAEIKKIAVALSNTTPTNASDAFIIGRCYESCLVAWTNLETVQYVMGRTTQDFWASEAVREREDAIEPGL